VTAGAEARLFVALPLPPLTLAQIAALRPAATKGVRPVADDDLHVTLHFLGNFSIEAARQALAAVDALAVDISFGPVGHFSPQRGRRILWIGIEASQSLLDLHRLTAEALVATGFESERRPYRPHVTLARLKPPAPPDLAKRLAEQAPEDAVEPVVCHEFALFRSETRPEGARYDVVEAWPLRA
jgi:2'-5' RNA ligase